MGRPKGSKNKSTLLKEGLLEKEDPRSDQEVLGDIINRFDLYHDMIVGTCKNVIHSLIVSGSAGVGKSYTAEWALKQRGLTNPNSGRFEIVRGTITAIELYTLAYRFQKEGDVLVLDDADRIFEDEEGLNILKSLLDTPKVRRVSYMSDHYRFKGEDKIDQVFDYRGSMIFLTNKNFQTYIDLGKNKYVDHMEALMSRSIYLDLKMHTRREVSLWVRHLVLNNHILAEDNQGKLTSDQEHMLMDWLIEESVNLRELSIRTALKLAKIFLMYPESWDKQARILLTRGY